PGSLLPVMLIGLVAFGLLGPYSYLGGAFALDFGGKQASAASSGIIDGIGYLGGVLAGYAAAWVARVARWHRAFLPPPMVGVRSAVSAGYPPLLTLRTAPLKPPPAAGVDG